MKQTKQLDHLQKIERTVFDKNILIGAHCSSESRVDKLLSLVDYIKSTTKNYNLYLVTHIFPHIKFKNSFDYIIYNANNPIMNKDIITGSSQNHLIAIFTRRGDKNLTAYRKSFYHGYAHHLSIRDGLMAISNQNTLLTHYMNYDVDHSLIDRLPEIEEMLQYKCDFVHFSYFEKSGINTEAFSLKDRIIGETIGDVVSFDDFFKYSHNGVSYGVEHIYKNIFKNIDSYDMGHFNDKKEKYSWIIGTSSFFDDIDHDNTHLLNSDISGLHIIPYVNDDGMKKILMNNSQYTGIPVFKMKFEFLSDNKLENTIEHELVTNFWQEHTLPVNCNRVKIYVNNILKAFFDVNDENNFGFIKVEKV